MNANQMIESRIEDSLGNDFVFFSEIAPYLGAFFVLFLVIGLVVNLNKLIIGIASLIETWRSK